MDKLIEIRNQERKCREHAQWDLERRDFWLAKAEEWEQRALDEIAFHFLECNGESITGDVTKTTRSGLVSTALAETLDQSTIMCDLIGDDQLAVL